MPSLGGKGPLPLSVTRIEAWSEGNASDFSSALLTDGNLLRFHAGISAAVSLEVRQSDDEKYTSSASFKAARGASCNSKLIGASRQGNPFRMSSSGCLATEKPRPARRVSSAGFEVHDAATRRLAVAFQHTLRQST